MCPKIACTLQLDTKPELRSQRWQQPTTRAVRCSVIAITKWRQSIFLKTLLLVHFVLDEDPEQYSQPSEILLSLSWDFTWLGTKCVGVIGQQCFWHCAKLAICVQSQEHSTSSMQGFVKVIAVSKVITWEYHPCVLDIYGQWLANDDDDSLLSLSHFFWSRTWGPFFFDELAACYTDVTRRTLIVIGPDRDPMFWSWLAHLF